MKLQYKCAICGNMVNGLGSHIVQVHHITCKEYYDKYLKKPGEGICANPNCNNETTFRGIMKGGYLKYCSCLCVQTDEKITLKKKETSKRLHGTPNYRNGEQARKTFLSNRTEEEIDSFYKKIIETRDNVSDKVKAERVEKSRKTRENKNKNHKWVSEETIKKTKETKKKNHGDENYNNRDKAIETCMELWGQPFPKQNKYKYNDLYFDSSWEIAYYIWLKDHNLNFEYHPSIKKTNLYYEWEGKIKSYHVDFIIEGQYVEIKNDILYKKLLVPNTKENEKFKLMLKNNVVILKYKEIKPFLKYINENYGKNYLKQFINSNEKL